jgi:hypothetical protein
VEHEWGLETVVAEVRTDIRHLVSEVADMRQEHRADIRRLDQRMFQLMLVQVATVAGVVGSLVAALAA